MTRTVNLSAHEALAAKENRLTTLIRPVKQPEPKIINGLWQIEAPVGKPFNMGENPPCSVFQTNDNWILAEVLSMNSPFTPGQVIVAREAWAKEYHLGRWTGVYFYKADNNAPDIWWRSEWKSPVTMPHWVARHHFKVLSVEVKRVEDVTDDEIMQWGIKPIPIESLGWKRKQMLGLPPDTSFFAAFNQYWNRRYKFEWCWVARVRRESCAS